MRQLHVVFGPSSRLSPPVAVAAVPVVIGREPGGESPCLVLDDEEASRRHAQVEVDHGSDTASIADLGSRNGMVVDGVAADRRPLLHGTVVRIGRTLLVMVDALVRPSDPMRRESAALRGGSLGMQRLRGEIGVVAPRASHVLVLGETGVGKELVAREVHERSGRGGALVAVNCAAIPENLAESELFGHAAGAFSGATARHEGLFGAAHGGTLFLDEIGELPAVIQPKLLRALATGEVRAVGRAEARQLDVRVVAATHRDLSDAIAAGRFRADLYARLAGWTLHVPPLRERREDILPLARFFLDRASGKIDLSAGAAEALLLHAWPYNVRELEQVMAAAVARVPAGGTLRSEHLPEEIARPVLARRPPAPIAAAPPPPEPGPGHDEQLGRGAAPPSADELRELLARFGGNVLKLAAFLGKDRRQIYRWAQRHGIDLAGYRDD